MIRFITEIKPGGRPEAAEIIVQEGPYGGDPGPRVATMTVPYAKIADAIQIVVEGMLGS